jgi:hypothetical protein
MPAHCSHLADDAGAIQKRSTVEQADYGAAAVPTLLVAIAFAKLKQSLWPRDDER